VCHLSESAGLLNDRKEQNWWIWTTLCYNANKTVIKGDTMWHMKPTNYWLMEQTWTKSPHAKDTWRHWIAETNDNIAELYDETWVPTNHTVHQAQTRREILNVHCRQQQQQKTDADRTSDWKKYIQLLYTMFHKIQPLPLFSISLPNCDRFSKPFRGRFSRKCQYNSIKASTTS